MPPWHSRFCTASRLNLCAESVFGGGPLLVGFHGRLQTTSEGAYEGSTEHDEVLPIQGTIFSSLASCELRVGGVATLGFQ
jgi:hypothetical protein